MISMMIYQFKTGIMILRIQQIYSMIFWRLEGCVDRHAPIKKLNSREIKLKVRPWISSELSNMIKVKNKLFGRKKRQPTNENVKLLYNIFRNRVNRELRKSKKSYYATYFEEHSNNIKKKHGKVSDQ